MVGWAREHSCKLLQQVNLTYIICELLCCTGSVCGSRDPGAPPFSVPALGCCMTLDCFSQTCPGCPLIALEWYVTADVRTGHHNLPSDSEFARATIQEIIDIHDITCLV